MSTTCGYCTVYLSHGLLGPVLIIISFSEENCKNDLVSIQLKV